MSNSLIPYILKNSVYKNKKYYLYDFQETQEEEFRKLRGKFYKKNKFWSFDQEILEQNMNIKTEEIQNNSVIRVIEVDQSDNEEFHQEIQSESEKEVESEVESEVQSESEKEEISEKEVQSEVEKQSESEKEEMSEKEVESEVQSEVQSKVESEVEEQSESEKQEMSEKEVQSEVESEVESEVQEKSELEVESEEFNSVNELQSCVMKPETIHTINVEDSVYDIVPDPIFYKLIEDYLF